MSSHPYFEVQTEENLGSPDNIDKLPLKREFRMSNTYPDASRYYALFTTPEQSSGVSCLHINFNKTKSPVTPTRSRALFHHAPSPASSSELSPYAQQMMANVRKSRSKREEGRKRSRFAEVVSRA